jgi:hydrogenase expression/formation protein HypC
MCLAVPGRIVEVRDECGMRMATIDFDGIRKEICLAYLPDIEVGDYAIVHVGFAISKIDEASAIETLAMFAELDVLDEERGAGTVGDGVDTEASL